MRLILSRKGVDSSAGGFPSPLFPDGSIWSVPIPDRRSPLRYRDLQMPEAASAIVRDLSRGRVIGSSRVHVDPDLEEKTLQRGSGWRALFGQHGAAQRHLQRQGVIPGDLFLFFGWFRQVQLVNRRWRFVANAQDLHLIFGWMQVGQITAVAQMRAHWAQYHPHFHGPFGVANSLYTAASGALQWARDCPSAGVFNNFRDDRLLSAPGCTRSIWQLPGWFDPRARGSALSYHTDPARWTRQQDTVTLKTAARGQEFVLDLAHYPEAYDWISGLFRD